MGNKQSLGSRIKNFGYKKVGLPRTMKMLEMEDQLAFEEDFLKYTDDSPIRFDIPVEIGRREKSGVPITLRLLPRMLSCVRNIEKAITELKDNPTDARKTIQDNELKNLEIYIKSLDISGIGYTKVPQEFIFSKKAIAFENAIVLTMNMDNKKVSVAPSKQTSDTIWKTYDNLGKAANKIARYLRTHGFSAHASHPLGGIALYPRLAEKAGLGGFGKSGLLSTPINCGTLRLAAVYTDIENLPLSEGNEHSWIMDYCKTCMRCVKECPAGAIYEQPIVHENGRETHIDNDRCFPYFADNYGCTVCIKVCPFNYTDYKIIKEGFEKRQSQQ